MDDTILVAKVTEVFRDVFDDDGIILRDEMTARDVDGWDSVANIQLMLAIEQALGIRFATSEISELKNVGELLAIARDRAR